MDVKAKQVAYHDWEAARYDEKFSISYDDRCIAYALGRYRKALPTERRIERVLEIGSGTGFFVINLWLAGVLGCDVHVTDISSRMLDVCRRNAADHGLHLVATPGDAEALPFPDSRFDLVLGHAVMHHLPDPARALREVHRVLAPGGRLVVAGEPTRWGERILRRVKRGTFLGWRAVLALPWLASWRKPQDARSEEEAALAALEGEVDLHTFVPGEIEAMAREAGFVEVRTVTEDLTAGWLGWAVRTIEGATAPGKLGPRWAFWAYRNYLRLQRLDERFFRRFVPKALFYNLVLHGRKPGLTVQPGPGTHGNDELDGT